MDTVQPILKRGRDVWDRINMPEKEFRQRVQRVQETMNKEGMDVFIAYGAGLNAYGNACYLSNYATRMPMGAMVFIPKTGDITFVFQGGSRELKAVQKTTWVEDTRSAMSLPQACIEYLNERNLMGSKVGIAGLREWMPCREFQAFVEGTGTCELIEANPILMEMRAVKSPRESDQMRRAARIVGLGFQFIEESLFQNANEKLIDAMIDREVRLEGIEDVRLLFGKPLETPWAMRPAEDLVPKDGDRYIVYLALSFERYWAEGIRTFLVEDGRFKKPASDKVTPLYDQVLSGMTPGKAVSLFYKEVIAEIEKQGLEPIPDYGLGQGIGLSLHEGPYIDGTDQTPMKQGMSFALRLAVKNGEKDTVMTGDTILLTEEGTEKLTA